MINSLSFSYSLSLCVCECLAQFTRVQDRMSVQEELDKLLFLVSDQSLTLLPDYYQRIKVGPSTPRYKWICCSSTVICSLICIHEINNNNKSFLYKHADVCVYI